MDPSLLDADRGSPRRGDLFLSSLELALIRERLLHGSHKLIRFGLQFLALFAKEQVLFVPGQVLAAEVMEHIAFAVIRSEMGHPP
jgi:hypothetical protein